MTEQAKNATATIDIGALNRAVAEAMPEQSEKMQAKHAEKGEAAGLEIQSFAGFDNLETTFCGAWPKVNKYVGVLLSTLGWLAPAQAAQARSVLNAINSVVVPAICGASGGTARAKG